MTVDLVAYAGEIIAGNRYLTLGTVGPDGQPWTSPVYFAAVGREFRWVSAVDALHSRHLVQRPRVSLVIFDSTVQPYHGRAVYAVGSARELDGDELDHALEAYPRPDDPAATPITRTEVTGSAAYRLYQVTTTTMWVLCPRRPGDPCSLHGIAGDHRALVP